MFSILTTTYNSEELIHRVYESLLSQTYKEFEWIISDDGSTDNTEQLVEKWQQTSQFPIIYHKMEKNQGKAYAINSGITLCTQPITINADADDTFVSNTLYDLKLIWDTINNSTNPNKIGAVWTLVQDESGKLIGEKWPKNFWQVSFQERVLDRKENIAGEKWHSWRTEVLLKHKKYTNTNSRISPSISWNRINKHYDFLCVNLIHRTYFSNPTGITQQKKTKLKVLKRIYYSAYYELATPTISQILRSNYYRNMSYSYFRARLKYKDEDAKLSGTKLFSVTLIFLFKLPLKILEKARSSS
ncbi:glycosyltransferase family A protein [Maribacter ulvicola]|uniref:Glycosyltransferase involved in cell wall bisynthesis n=1 Tax=Maribacter ulvicola TaxID=228959 RepID=A0A1N6VIA0_9FLAO|nr:glycosyltransferase family 2 protein [Maribacter ulvicola]SIQ77602.1 Glycosyltransferase involved in cell wall bisynthesis [Maribacter ulvicola]